MPEPRTSFKSASTLFDAGFRSGCDALALAMQRGRGAGASASSELLGGGERSEFAGVRPYAPGDDVRDLDWPAYARWERMFIREYRREEGGEMLVRLDCSASMGDPGKWREARRVAGAFAYLAVKAGMTARVEYHDGERVRSVAALTDANAFLAWGAGLESLQPFPPGHGGGDPTHGELPRCVRGRGDLVLVSDLLGDSMPGNRLVAAAEQGWRVSLVQTLTHEELVPPTGLLDLRDAEGDGRALVHVSARQVELYEQEMSRLIEGWRSLARRHGIRYLLCDASRGILETLRMAVSSGELIR